LNVEALTESLGLALEDVTAQIEAANAIEDAANAMALEEAEAEAA